MKARYIGPDEFLAGLVTEVKFRKSRFMFLLDDNWIYGLAADWEPVDEDD